MNGTEGVSDEFCFQIQVVTESVFDINGSEKVRGGVCDGVCFQLQAVRVCFLVTFQELIMMKY